MLLVSLLCRVVYLADICFLFCKGRLGDLGAIDSKYDVAISTACPQLNNIVVDSSATGQKAVAYLRAQKLGRATFIMMDKISNLASSANAHVNTPEQVPRLFDLVTCSPDYKTAFYFALRDTLVADNLEVAVRLAYGRDGKRWRVVTLAGELIDTSGNPIAQLFEN